MTINNSTHTLDVFFAKRRFDTLPNLSPAFLRWRDLELPQPVCDGFNIIRTMLYRSFAISISSILLALKLFENGVEVADAVSLPYAFWSVLARRESLIDQLEEIDSSDEGKHAGASA